MGRLEFMIEQVKEKNPELKNAYATEIIESLKGCKKLVLIKIGGKDGWLPTVEDMEVWRGEFKQYETKYIQFLIVPNVFETETILLGKLRKKKK